MSPKVYVNKKGKFIMVQGRFKAYKKGVVGDLQHVIEEVEFKVTI